MGSMSPSRLGKNSAARAKKLSSQELAVVAPREDLAIVRDTSQVAEVEAKFDPMQPFQAPLEKSELQLAAARLYGQGFKRAQIARALVNHLTAPDSAARTDEQKLAQARKKLKRWEYSQAFRDMVYKHAVVEIDMATPGILQGLTRSAKRGRVDAARLALELTGRHSKDDASVPTQVTVNLIGVARPE